MMKCEGERGHENTINYLKKTRQDTKAKEKERERKNILTR